MSLSVFEDDDMLGLDPLVVALEEFSRRMAESTDSGDISCSSEIQLAGWVVERSRNGSCKVQNRKSAPLKEQRSKTPGRTISRQLTRNREESIEFKHHVNLRRYIEEYRNDKILRQEAALKELLNRNERHRGSDSCLDCGKGSEHFEHLIAAKHAPSVVSMKDVPSTLEDDNATKPLIVVSSKGLSRPANLPMSGHFQGRKLQYRPTVYNRTMKNSKGSQWSQSHADVTLEITSQGSGDVSHHVTATKQSDDYNPPLERRHSGNLVVRRAELTASATSLRVDSRTTPQPNQGSLHQGSAIEKCDAWVKNRHNDLGSIKGSKDYYKGEQFKPRNLRNFHTPQVTSQLVMRGNTLPSAAQKDSVNVRSADGSTNVPSSSPTSMGMDYSQYTDMFKNVLEFYGTRRLRPKSHSAVEQLLSMKS